MSTIKPSELARAVNDILEDWQGVTDEAAKRGVQKAAEEAVSDLRGAHPPGSEKYGSWAAYNNGWTSRKDSSKKGVYTQVVHNKKKYQLTHLLENGHAIKGGGRARAFPHIAPVAEKIEDKLLEIIKSGLN